MSKKAEIIFCNYCGKAICTEDQRETASYLAIKKEWGYFSDGKDGTVHSMDICEECYDRMVQEFSIAPQIDQVTELV